MSKSIAKNALFNTSYKILNILFPLITSMYLARVLGPVYIGKVTYAQNIMSYFLVVASLGIPTYGTREIARVAQNKSNTNRVFTELFVMNAISSVVCSFVFTAVVFMVGQFRSDMKLYLCVGVTLYMNILNVDWFYSGKEEYVYITIRSFLIKILSIVSIFLFVQEESSYLTYAFIISLATTGNYILNIFNIRKRISFHFEHLNLKKHLKPVLILLMTLLATDLYNQIDITMIGAFRTEEEIGYYANGVKLIRIVYSITSAISATIIPRMSLLFAQKKIKEMNRLYNQILQIVLLIALPSSLGLIMLSKSIVSVLFGETFLPTSNIINILAVIIIIISISYLSGSVILTATNNEKYLLKATFSGAVGNIILNIVLIPQIGINGAAIASVISEFIVFIVHIYYAKKYVKIRVDKRYIYSLLASLSALLIIVVLCKKLFSSNWGILISSVLSGIILYFAMLSIMRNPVIGKCKKIISDKYGIHN